MPQNEFEDSINIPTGYNYKINDIPISSFNFFETTAGSTGAEYATVGAAVTAGKTRILVVSNTTETADITFNTNVNYIITSLPGITIDFSSYISNIDGTSIIEFNNSSLFFSYSTVKSLYTGTSGSAKVVLNNCKITNNSTIDGARISAGITIEWKDGYFKCSNYKECGVVGNILSQCSFINILIEGGGTGCYEIFDTSISGLHSIIFENIRFIGTFNTSGATIRGIRGSRTRGIITSVTDIQLDFSDGSQDAIVSDIINLDGKIVSRAANFSICNFECKDIDFTSGGKATNGTINTAYTLADSNIIFVNCKFKDLCTVTGSKNIFIGCIFIGGVIGNGDSNIFNGCNSGATVTISGDRNKLIGCNIGDTNAGSKTIDDNGTSNIHIGNTTEAAIDIAGATTPELNNNNLF